MEEPTARTLDNSNNSIQPSFGESTADEFFGTLFSSETKVFLQPSWLPSASPPQVPFNSDDITTAEIQRVMAWLNQSQSPPQVSLIRSPTKSSKSVHH